MKCCFCGTVRNCGQYLLKNFENIERLAELFSDYEIIIVYDKSNDDTLKILKDYKEKNPKLKLYIIPELISPYRTHRLAHARNICLDYVRNNNYDIFIMMDLDNVNAKEVNTDVLKNYLEGDNFNLWDSLSFNTSPKYYDIWALSIYPYCFSYNHFHNNGHHNYDVIQNYIEKVLKKNKLVRCISSFNGFSIYKTDKFKNSRYDGTLNLSKIPLKYLLSHIKASRSKIIFHDYGHVNGFHEDCEHRLFHINALHKNNARIMISSDKLFT